MANNTAMSVIGFLSGLTAASEKLNEKNKEERAATLQLLERQGYEVGPARLGEIRPADFWSRLLSGQTVESTNPGNFVAEMGGQPVIARRPPTVDLARFTPPGLSDDERTELDTLRAPYVGKTADQHTLREVLRVQRGFLQELPRRRRQTLVERPRRAALVAAFDALLPGLSASQQALGRAALQGFAGGRSTPHTSFGSLTACSIRPPPVGSGSPTWRRGTGHGRRRRRRPWHGCLTMSDTSPSHSSAGWRRAPARWPRKPRRPCSGWNSSGVRVCTGGERPTRLGRGVGGRAVCPKAPLPTIQRRTGARHSKVQVASKIPTCRR